MNKSIVLPDTPEINQDQYLISATINKIEYSENYKYKSSQSIVYFIIHKSLAN